MPGVELTRIVKDPGDASLGSLEAGRGEGEEPEALGISGSSITFQGF